MASTPLCEADLRRNGEMLMPHSSLRSVSARRLATPDLRVKDWMLRSKDQRVMRRSRLRTTQDQERRKHFEATPLSDLHDRLVAKCKSTMGAGSLDFEIDGYGYTIDCSRNLQIAYHTRYTRQIRVHTVATVGFILITQLRQPPLEGVITTLCNARRVKTVINYTNNPDSTPSIPTAPRTAPQQHSSGTAGTYRH